METLFWRTQPFASVLPVADGFLLRLSSRFRPFATPKCVALCPSCSTWTGIDVVVTLEGLLRSPTLLDAERRVGVHLVGASSSFVIYCVIAFSSFFYTMQSCTAWQPYTFKFWWPTIDLGLVAVACFLLPAVHPSAARAQQTRHLRLKRIGESKTSCRVVDFFCAHPPTGARGPPLHGSLAHPGWLVSRLPNPPEGARLRGTGYFGPLPRFQGPSLHL